MVLVLKLDWVQLELVNLGIQDGLLGGLPLLDLLLRAHHDVVVVLHLAEARKDGHTDVTVALDAVDGESLSHSTQVYS